MESEREAALSESKVEEATGGGGQHTDHHGFVFEREEWPNGPLHAHFDCFSGAAGDMMLAACLDAAGRDSDRLRDHISRCLTEGLPAIAGEFHIVTSRVWRGQGFIGAKHVKVESLYRHQAAPVPGSSRALRADMPNDVSHSHSPSREHPSHSHEHHSHSHSHQHRDEEKRGSSKGNVEFILPDHRGPMRNLPQIREMLQDASDSWIPLWVKETAIQTFTQLALAEMAVHAAVSEDEVHFHEVGAVDSIVDTVGTLLALYVLGVTSVSCSRLPLGEGYVKTDHGILPVPAPATLCLMIGMPTTKGPPKATGELVTPTGAALLQVLTRLNPVSPIGEPPPFTLRRVGVGAGTKDFKGHPNILRLMLGDLSKKDSDKSDSQRDSESSANATDFSGGL